MTISNENKEKLQKIINKVIAPVVQLDQQINEANGLMAETRQQLKQANDAGDVRGVMRLTAKLAALESIYSNTLRNKQEAVKQGGSVSSPAFTNLMNVIGEIAQDEQQNVVVEAEEIQALQKELDARKQALTSLAQVKNAEINAMLNQVSSKYPNTSLHSRLMVNSVHVTYNPRAYK